MKLFQIQYRNEKALDAWFRQIRIFCENKNIRDSSIIFHIYCDSLSRECALPVIMKIRETFPQAVYGGITSTGNIVHGSLSASDISINAAVYEDPEFKAMVLQMPLTCDTQDEAVAVLAAAVSDCPWVRAVEVLTTMAETDMAGLCRQLSGLPESVRLFGGGAMASEIKDGDTRKTYVFSNRGDPAPFHIVFILFGGPSLVIEERRLTGWRQIGRQMAVTSMQDKLLEELDHRPAAEVYQYYLNIPGDQRFFGLANVFPLEFRRGDISFLRVVTSICDKGALRIGASASEADTCCITYGDRESIMESLEEVLRGVQAFSPEVIYIYSCVARKFFWGKDDVSLETLPFESLATTSAFYTSGEFLRRGREVVLHNNTQVVVAMREGEPEEEKRSFYIPDEGNSRQLQISQCLANFVKQLARDLENDG